MRLLRLVALALAASIAGGCPPPTDADRTYAEAPPAPAGGGDVPSAPSHAPSGTGGAGAAGAAAGAGARATDGQVPVAYEQLRGGVFVPRCPACGQVQAEGAEKCPGCGQTISPWRKEWTCGPCAGGGDCDHCGEERACHACDGDGRCPSCNGAGRAAQQGAPCAECGGGGTCAACRGDGRRDGASGDFLPTEGSLAGACATCIDASGLCPECGSGGRDTAGGACGTCAGGGLCPDCQGEGVCGWCGGLGACAVCAGTGREVRNGARRGPDQIPRAIRTSAGSSLTVRVAGPPTSQGIRAVRTEGGRPVETVFTRGQLAPLSWLSIVRAFPPGWEGRTSPEGAELAQFHLQVCDDAVQAGQWAVALLEMRAAAAADPSQAPAVRVKAQELEAKRVDAWIARAEAAVKDGDPLRAAQLFEMAAFAGRGSASGKRAEIRLLGTRKDREQELSKLDDAGRARRAVASAEAVERAVARARRRLERSRQLLQRATSLPEAAGSADATFARASAAAWAARRVVEAAAFRDPPGASVPWSVAPPALVTEARLASASVHEAWATRAAGAGRFDLAVRLARRGLASDPASDALKTILGEAERGLVRAAVLDATPPPGGR